MEALLTDAKDQKLEFAGIWWKILICCVVLLGVGAVNALWTRVDYQGWFESLVKPSFSPSPRWIVGAIWSVMYILMGISVGMIWQLSHNNKNTVTEKRAGSGIRIFVLQILVNMSVPAFFFGLNNLPMVLIGVTLNLILVIILLRYFYRLYRPAGLILIPYLVWLIYATLLDLSMLLLN